MGKRVPDEFVLLCESCGYDIEGLPEDGACPECGRPIADSIPGNRLGTPAQRRHTVRTLQECWRLTLTRPRCAFSVANPGSPHDAPIRAASLLAAASTTSLGLTLPTLLDKFLLNHVYYLRVHPNFGTVLATVIFGIMALALGVFVALLVLTFIEERGIRFWGPRRGWRITPAISRTICAHASVGWVLGSVLMVAGHLLGLYLAHFPNRHNLGIFRGPMQLAPISLPILGFLAGMLTFEILVYIGMSRMKFANRVKPAPSPLVGSMPPASMPSSSINPLPERE